MGYKEEYARESFYGDAADRIVNDLHPKTVLDAGCGAGYLVAALRDRGVDAYGIDPDREAVSQVREDIRPFCVVGALNAPIGYTGLPEKFDLITNLDVLERMGEEDGKKAVALLCRMTDRILFSSDPDAGGEHPQGNARQREYWSRLFAENGFADDLNDRPTFLREYAVCYRRCGSWLDQLEEYERYIRKTDGKMKEEALAWSRAIEDKNRLIEAKDKQYEALRSSLGWRVGKPIQQLWDLLRENVVTRLFTKGIQSLGQEGFDVTFKKVLRKLRLTKPTGIQYSKKELRLQRESVFPKAVKFSILVPLYNTPERFLREMIQSVLDQTYGNWELCLADGSDGAHKYVGEICESYSAKDPRIRYRKLEKNLGISGNTNACIDMAEGEYISLFDHDDLLHPAALHEVMTAVCQQGADFIYTDENTFHKTPKDAFCPHFKPDFAPDNLRANNYICHFTTFRKDLLDKVGKFRPECDGSQDFDMMLRLTEKAEKIVHIPRILYYWRAHANSVAEDVGAKPYVIDAAKRAIHDHLERVGLKGEVLDTPVPSMYRLRYEIIGNPLISIIIPNYENKTTLQTCLNSIFEKSTYRNFEVIVIENNSKSSEIFDYYREIQSRWRNVKVITWNGPFNYSAINNFGVQSSGGEHILLLNNDTEVISPDWIQEMLMYSQRGDVGAVGAKLYYPDNTVQHAGLGIGLLSLAGHLHRNFERSSPGYMGRLIYAQNLSGVTAACMMIRRTVWNKIGGLDESLAVTFNDVDMCMRIRAAGYLIVWTPFAELYHYESKSRGQDDNPEKEARFHGEVARFQERWKAELAAGDPYYNPNFSLDCEDFSIL